MRVRSRPDGFAAAVICAPTTAVLLALSTLVVPGPAQADPAPEPTPSPGPAVGDYGPPPVTFNPGNLPGAVDLQPPAAPPSVIDFQPPTVQQPKVWEGDAGGMPTEYCITRPPTSLSASRTCVSATRVMYQLLPGETGVDANRMQVDSRCNRRLRSS